MLSCLTTSCRTLCVPAVLLVVLIGAASARAQSAPTPARPTPTPSAPITQEPATGANPLNVPDLSGIVPTAGDREGVSTTLRILVLLTVLTLVPSVLVMTTCFPRIIIVLALLRQAVGTPQLPPSQVLLGLSLFMTFMIMSPTWYQLQAEAVTPYLDGKMGQEEAFEIVSARMKGFMYRQIEQTGNFEDIYLFLEYSRGAPIPPTEQVAVESVPLSVMIPAFLLSELKTAFIMGFRIYLPFLVIDMVIATILISMGMMMLPPVLISLPFKLLLFVLADGWHLVVETLLYSFV